MDIHISDTWYMYLQCMYVGTYRVSIGYLLGLHHHRHLEPLLTHCRVYVTFKARRATRSDASVSRKLSKMKKLILGDPFWLFIPLKMKKSQVCTFFSLSGWIFDNSSSLQDSRISKVFCCGHPTLPTLYVPMSVHLSIFDMLVDMVSEPQIAPRVIQHKYTSIYYNVHIIHTFDASIGSAWPMSSSFDFQAVLCFLEKEYN